MMKFKARAQNLAFPFDNFVSRATFCGKYSLGEYGTKRKSRVFDGNQTERSGALTTELLGESR